MEKVKVQEWVAVVLFLLATVGIISGILILERTRRNRLGVVQLVARAPEYGNWYPQKIETKAGEELTLMIRNIDTVSHGFALPEFNVAVPEIKAGEVKMVSFLPDKEGTYTFFCTVWCSSRHMEMQGELIVE